MGKRALSGEDDQLTAIQRNPHVEDRLIVGGDVAREHVRRDLVGSAQGREPGRAVKLEAHEPQWFEPDVPAGEEDRAPGPGQAVPRR